MMMGVTEDMFWKSTVRKLKPYGEYYRKRQFEIDRISHRMGAYVYEAVAVAVSNALSGKKGKAHKYRDKPYMAEEEERIKIEHMTEEEKLERVEKIFDMLQAGQM